jgi:hypothetical protein
MPSLPAWRRRGKATGDFQMMPGAFIVDTHGVIRYAYYGQYAGDDPPIDELIAAAQALRAEPNPLRPAAKLPFIP